MSKSRIDDDWELNLSSYPVSNLVLFGTTGNGKSATGNSILGREAFLSEAGFLGVTSTCELQSTVLRDGRILNVIDTPGLFDRSDGSDSEVNCKEIVRCVNLAKDGIHAILMVFSIRSRFTVEEEATIRNLRTIFGDKILNYMIVVFTGGDDLESTGRTLKDYLGYKKHQSLQKFLEDCQNRIVLFDNKTKDKKKQASQLQQLLNLVDSVLTSNGGKPFSDLIFDELKEGASRLQLKEKEFEAMNGYSEEQICKFKEEIYKSYDDQLSRITEMIELKLKETVDRLEKQLAEEQAARLEAEKISQEARMRSDEEIHKLRESLERAQKEVEEFRKRGSESKMCIIL